MSRNLLVRIAFAVPAIAVAVTVLWRGGWLLAGLLAVLGVLGTREVYAFARRQGIDPLDMLGYVGAAAIPFGANWVIEADISWIGPTLALGALWLMAVLVAATVARGPERRPLSAVSVTVFGCLYASALLAFIIPIRHGIHSEAHPLASTALVLFPLALTWIGDTCAMAGGTLVGGAKLAPVLSPRKTWAGAVAGVIGSLVAALAFGHWVFARFALELPVAQLLTIALIVAVAAQVGDVVESLFKREVGLKDSSALIPGHGGALDRLDSLYFVVPVSAMLFWVFGLI
jgi:phosphatidate cytidylyltransferase